MTLIETYANSCGVKLPSKPVEPYTSYFTVPERYITIQTESGQPSKNYTYYNIAIELIKNILHKHNIHIIQIGSKNDSKVGCAIQLQGQTTLSQAFYIVKHAMLHVGGDSVFQHAAGAFNVPSVVLFGSTLASVCGSFYKHKKTKFIQSPLNTEKPSYSPYEQVKSINNIRPEEVAQEILNALGIEHKVNLVTRHIGLDFGSPEIHIIPDKLKITNFPVDRGRIYIRLDMCNNLNILDAILSKFKASIICSEPIPVNILEKYKNNIESIEFKVFDIKSVNVGFISYIQKFKNIISTRMSGDDLVKLKIGLLEVCDVDVRKDEVESLMKGEYFFSSKLFISGDSFFLSKYHWERNLVQPPKTLWAKTPKEFNQSFINSQSYYFNYDRR